MHHTKVKERVESSIEHYWGGIKELVEVYYSRPRPVEQELYWIKVSVYKEIKAIPKILPILGEQFLQLDRGVDRRLYEGLAYEMADEIKHYRLLAEIVEWLTKGKVSPDQCGPSPEQTRLEELRRALKDDLGLVPHLNVAHETVFASAVKNIAGGPLEKKIAAAYRQVYRDELKHYSLGWKELESQELDDGQIERVALANKTVARQYLVMRNEMFGHPISQSRLNEIDEGKVEPYRPR
jgi:hypothetical protein